MAKSKKKILGLIKLQIPAGKANPSTPVIITAYEDKSFTFITKLPPVSYYIKKAAGVKSASKTPGKEVAGKITMAQVKEIAEAKMPDLNCSTVEAAMNMVKGQAVSMGIQVTE